MSALAHASTNTTHPHLPHITHGYDLGLLATTPQLSSGMVRQAGHLLGPGRSAGHPGAADAAAAAGLHPHADLLSLPRSHPSAAPASPRSSSNPPPRLPPSAEGPTPAAPPGVPPGAAPLNPLLKPRAPTPWAAPRQPQGTPLPSFRSACLASWAGPTGQQVDCCPTARLGLP